MVMVYSDYALAVREAPEKVAREERDLFLCYVKYPSGEEFVLKPTIPPGFTYIERFRLPFHHHFSSSLSAVRAANRFEEIMGVSIKVNPKTYYQNGYKCTSHFELCLA